MEYKCIIVCNLAEATKTAKKGALCYLSNTSGGAIGDGSINLMVRSRGGRMIEKWERIKRLENFRFKTIPPENPIYNDDRYAAYYGEETLNHILQVKNTL